MTGILLHPKHLKCTKDKMLNSIQSKSIDRYVVVIKLILIIKLLAFIAFTQNESLNKLMKIVLAVLRLARGLEE